MCVRLWVRTPVPHKSGVVMPLIPVFGRRKQKDQKFKVPFCQVRFYLTEGEKDTRGQFQSLRTEADLNTSFFLKFRR